MWPALLLVASALASASGHGRVLEPPSRASAWRYGYPVPADYDDDGANCGGYSVQHVSNSGKCGICGDAYSIPPPRPHELGGVYGVGIIVAHYLPGSLISTTVDLTTSHRGFWQFKLCADPEANDQECFDKHVLELEDGSTKYYPDRGSVKYNVTYVLPKGLVCDHCVLQWRYTAGNNWGTCQNGTQGLGCGPQEQFGACSDISIGMSKQRLREMPDNDEIPYPLFYYMKNGYFDAQQGLLNLLRGIVRSPVHNQQSIRQYPSHQIISTQRPTHPARRPTHPTQRPSHPTQRPTHPTHRPISTHRPTQSPPRSTQSKRERHSNKQWKTARHKKLKKRKHKRKGKPRKRKKKVLTHFLKFIDPVENIHL
ncbi:uncharacterized protein LOC126373994 isoform X2 [Pectinophora gossypiella]|nr:uncharacterized protein LOC126373994 isoform X2 [Pectinophora gossypiella]XP_049876388.1 uncharacterized protein LOC126373994 isoform X2 [Pectinophora gossypiella]